jgi:integrase
MRLYLVPRIGHVPLERLRVTDVVSVFDYIDDLNAAVTAARASGDPVLRGAVKGRRLVGPASCQRIRSWQLDFEVRLAAARAAGGRVDPVGVWVSAPRPSPVMVWTPEQTAVFLKAARRHRLHALWRLIATRGLRRGEACGLRRSDTDLSVALTTVRWQIT